MFRDVANSALLLALLTAPARAQCPDGTPPPCSRPAALRVPAPNSVAVLYFENATRDSSDQYLADGLTEEVITRLSGIERLEVKSRHAVRRYRGGEIDDLAPIARALGVAYLVTGTVRRSGGQLHVGAELIRANGGVQVWGQQFDQAAGNVFAVQEAVAREVATGIVGRLLPAERASVGAQPTRNPAAYDQLLRGNFDLARRTEGSVARAQAEYQRALDLDPTFVQAQARIAYASALMLDWGYDGPGGSDAILARGFAAADRALAIDPGSSDAWMARAYLMEFRNPVTFDGVLAGFEHAIALGDGRNAEAWHQYSAALLRMRRDSAAIVATQRALAIEPGRPITLMNMATGSSYGRQLGDAIRWVDSTLAVDPAFGYGLGVRSVYRLRRGDLAGARADAEAAIRANAPSSTPEATLVVIAARTGDSAAARQGLEAMRREAAGRERIEARRALSFARACLALGRPDDALGYLEQAKPRGLTLGNLLRSPDLDPLRSMPRFQRLVDETNPPPPTN